MALKVSWRTLLPCLLGVFGTYVVYENLFSVPNVDHTSAPLHVANDLGARTKYSVALTTTSVPDACGYVRVVEVHNNVSQHTVTKLEAELKAAQDCGTEINTKLCTCTPKATPGRRLSEGATSGSKRNYDCMCATDDAERSPEEFGGFVFDHHAIIPLVTFPTEALSEMMGKIARFGYQQGKDRCTLQSYQSSGCTECSLDAIVKEGGAFGNTVAELRNTLEEQGFVIVNEFINIKCAQFRPAAQANTALSACCRRAL